jgi:hypothetical protein
MKVSFKKLLLIGLLVGLIVAAWQWKPIFGLYLDYRISRVTTSLPTIDRVEVFHLSGSGLDEFSTADATNGFPVRPYGGYSRILDQTTLTGSDAVSLAALWRAQTFGWNYQALCHQAAYGFRYYSGSKLIYETSVCFKCSNFYYTVFGDAGWHGFDTESPKAAELLARLQDLFPESIPASKRGPSPSEKVKDSLKRADEMIKAGDLAGGARMEGDILRDSLAGIIPSTQSLADTFVACYVVAQTAENAFNRGDRELAITLCQDAIEGLSRCKETMPDWNPTIVSYRLKRTEELLARIK